MAVAAARAQPPQPHSHDRSAPTFALPLSKRPSERVVSPAPRQGERCLHHKRSPPQRAVHSKILFLATVYRIRYDNVDSSFPCKRGEPFLMITPISTDRGNFFVCQRNCTAASGRPHPAAGRIKVFCLFRTSFIIKTYGNFFF